METVSCFHMTTCVKSPWRHVHDFLDFHGMEINLKERPFKILTINTALEIFLSIFLKGLKGEEGGGVEKMVLDRFFMFFGQKYEKKIFLKKNFLDPKNVMTRHCHVMTHRPRLTFMSNLKIAKIAISRRVLHFEGRETTRWKDNLKAQPILMVSTKNSHLTGVLISKNRFLKITKKRTRISRNRYYRIL